MANQFIVQDPIKAELINREQASQFAYDLLRKYNLNDWKVRLSGNMNFLGKTVYSDKCIYLNYHQIDTHPKELVHHTIKHEIAHALCPNEGHNDIWAAKAIELGCLNTNTCGESLDARAIDAIRSGHTIEVDYITEVTIKPRYTIHQLGDVCSICGKKAEEKSHSIKGDYKIVMLKCGHMTMKVLPKQTPFEQFISTDADPNCKHDWNGTKCVNCPAKKLYKFQVVGARNIERSFGRHGLFDVMGLGKTIQSLAWIKYHNEALPVLFILKSGLKYQFLSEILLWLGDQYLAQVISSSKQYPVKGFKCYIISYDMLRRYPIQKFKELGIKTVVLDECQLIKNVDSSRTSAVRQIVKHAQYFIPLSGTPWKNRGSEYFPVLNMLDPVRFSSQTNFINRWVDYYEYGDKTKEGGIRNIPAFKEYVKDIVTRREREEVDAEFPNINRIKFNHELDDTTREVYDQEVSDFVKEWNKAVIGGEENTFEQSTHVLARLNRMRHMLGLSKIPATIELAESFIEETERKLVVFVHHQDVGKLVYDKLTQNETVRKLRYKVLRLTSDLSSIDRFDLQNEFNATERVILVASTLASGEGLNLQTCGDCIIHERQWNPANEEQVEGRFIRIGSTYAKVNSTYVHASNSIDTKFDSIVEQKRIQFHAAMNKGEQPIWNESSMINELIQSIVQSSIKGKKS